MGGDFTNTQRRHDMTDTANSQSKIPTHGAYLVDPDFDFDFDFREFECQFAEHRFNACE